MLFLQEEDTEYYYDLRKRTMGDNSKTNVLFKQTLNNVESFYKYIAGFDMSYDEFMELCRETWKDEDYGCFYIDSSKKKSDEN